MKRKVVLPFLCLIGSLGLYGQEETLFTRSFTVIDSSFSDTISVHGTIDGVNSYTRQYGVQLWNTPSVKIFEPLKSLTLRNTGNTSIIAPRLLINGRGNWFDNSSIANEAINGSQTIQDTVLSILYFVYKNRVSYMVPNIDAYFGSKLLPVYGYGSCDMSAYNVRLIATELEMARQSIPMPHHTVSQLVAGSKGYLIDSDFATFYLGLDNSTISSYEDIINDRYLLRRTKHFGKNMSYNKYIDEFVSLIYYNDLKKFLKSSPVKGAGENPIIANSTYDFILRPNESLTLDYGESAFWYQNWDGFETVPEEYPLTVIGNGLMKLETGFTSDILNEILFSFDSISLVDGRIVSTDTNGEFSILFESPFPIHSGIIDVDLYFGSVNDSIILAFSYDGNNWENVDVFTGSGNVSRHVNLSPLFEMTDYRQIVPFTYKYYISFSILERSRAGLTGIDSLSVSNTFQLSRFFMPALTLGSNIVEYSDSNGADGRELEIVINWSENSVNAAPLPVANPIFPIDSGVVERLYFEFKWEDTNDPDGDEIVDYEFFLSSDSTMQFPHSPNFNIYTSASEENAISSFMTKEKGWLNSGERYFWRVRARDSFGIWGPWSETWSFTPYGVMRPLNPVGSVMGDSLSLIWEHNISGKPASHYRVYGSQETGGFTPCENDLIIETVKNEARIAIRDSRYISSFRVTAVSMDGEESGPSAAAQLPPYLAPGGNMIEPGISFHTNMIFPKQYWPYYYFGYDTLILHPSIQANHLPYWISYESDSLFGEPDFSICHRAIYDSTLTEMRFSYVDKDSIPLTFTHHLKSSLINSVPILKISDSIAYTGELYNAYVAPADDDHLYGDTVIYEVKYAPFWASYRVNGDTLEVSGYAPETGSLDSLVVKATDVLGETTVSCFKVNILNRRGQRLSILPGNPKGAVTVLVAEEGLLPERAVLVDMAGRIRRIQDLNSGLFVGSKRFDFDISNLEPGVYIIRVFCKQNGELKILSKSFYIGE